MKILFIILLFLCLPLFIFAETKININSALLSELDQITGVGPATAQKIIDNRPYNSLDDLLKVKGIGPATLEKIKTQGLACVNCTTVIPSLIENPVINIENTQNTLDSNLCLSCQQAGESDATEALPIIYPKGVIINEILPNPEGADEENEFIEIYNNNNFDIDLSGWKLQDQVGSQVTYIIKENSKIKAFGFLVFTRPISKISLNNSQDTLNLLFPDNKIADSISFTSAKLGQSYNLNTAKSWAWSTTLTPGVGNIITQPVTIKESSKNKGLPKPQNSDNNIINADELLADLSKPTNTLNNQNNPWFLFIITFSVAIICAIIILIIKFKIIKN